MNLKKWLYAVWMNLSHGLVGLFVFFIFFFLGIEAWPFIASEHFIELFLHDLWYPKEGNFGAQNLILGTLWVTGLGVLITLPLSFFSAIAVTFYISKKWKKIWLLFFQTCAGLPSVIVGLFGLLVLVPFFGKFFPPGFGLLAAGLVLSLLLIPQGFVAFYDILNLGLEQTQLVSKSLGLSLNTLIRKVLWPEKRHAFFRSAGLLTGRSLGETLAILMVAGNAIRRPEGLFDSFRTLNATLALEIPYAQGLHRASLFGLGLITLCIVLVLQLVVREKKS